jgi:DGQHR domain-containing protein
VKGTQKNTEFYLTTLEYGEVDSLVVLPDDFQANRLLDDEEQMQRKLSWTRVKKEMKDYLLNYEDSFYSALTLFIVPRSLEPLRDGEGFEFKPTPPGGKNGTLELRSNCVLFPGDGQHRAASIKEALKERWELASQEVPVVLIPFTHSSKVRQLFSDLNLNAKPVNRTIGLSFETRDPVAVLSKRVGEDVPLFQGRVNRWTNSLPTTSENVITMNALYAGNLLLLHALGKDVAELTALAPSDSRVGEVAEELSAVWETIIDAIPAWRSVLDGDMTPGEAREKFIFAHGLGWQAIAHAASVAIKVAGDDWADVLGEALTTIGWERTNPDWQLVAMVGDRVNNTGPGIRATAGYILEAAGIDGEPAKSYLDALASSRNQEDETLS